MKRGLESDEFLLEWIPQWVDNQIGLDAANWVIWNRTIHVSSKAVGCGHPEANSPQMRQEWKETAEAMVEDLARQGYEKFEVSSFSGRSCDVMEVTDA